MGASENGSQVNPREHDETTARLYGELETARARQHSAMEALHRSLGDKRAWHGRTSSWGLSNEDALRIARDKAMLETPGPSRASHPVNVLNDWHALHAEVGRLTREYSRMEMIYREHRWTRYFPCLNTDGHIHSSLACQTLRAGTAMGWTPALSGKSVADAIADLGPTLCSVCFPDAPAEHCRSRSDITRAERDAAKAARAEAKFAKNLRESEQFRDTWGWVTTVAGALKVLREEVEYRDYYGHGRHPSWAETAEAAKAATRVLLAREAAAPGTGKTQEEIDKIIASAVKRNIKDGARLNADGSVKA